MITNGVSHGIDLACAQLTKPGDIVVVELPTYFLAADVFRDNGLDVVGVDGLEEGIGPDGLPDGTPGYFDVGALERRLRVDGLRPRLVYLVPTHSNPRGGTLPERDRKRLVKLAVEFNFYVLADEVYCLQPPGPRGHVDALRLSSMRVDRRCCGKESGGRHDHITRGPSWHGHRKGVLRGALGPAGGLGQAAVAAA